LSPPTPMRARPAEMRRPTVRNFALAGSGRRGRVCSGQTSSFFGAGFDGRGHRRADRAPCRRTAWGSAGPVTKDSEVAPSCRQAPTSPRSRFPSPRPALLRLPSPPPRAPTPSSRAPPSRALPSPPLPSTPQKAAQTCPVRCSGGHGLLRRVSWPLESAGRRPGRKARSCRPTGSPR
jgi:hypothetical protein